jgi:3-oxoacyl-[acyl-carrier protein] reductase
MVHRLAHEFDVPLGEQNALLVVAAAHRYQAVKKIEEAMSKDGLCAIVTGSASGLGAATAAVLAKGGGKIAVNYSNSKKEAEETADLCRKAGADVVVVQGDVSRDEDCRKIVAAVGGWGGLDILVNNAGTTKHVPHNDLDGLSAEDFQRIYAVNTIGPFQMIRAARPLLETAAKASGHASSVVNVSSVAGIGGGGSSVAYAASKGALNTITQSLARALAPLIRVNTVCPGYIDTPWFTKGQGADGAKQVRDMIIAKVPLKTASTAEEIAQLVCFLALPQSGQMTGEFVRMDAGLHLVQ